MATRHERASSKVRGQMTGGNSRRTFFTIGYQAHTVFSIIKVLRANNVALLVDVRESPTSRKPGFSKGNLDKSLSNFGIDYMHFPCLGTPPAIRRYYLQGGRTEVALQRYDRYLESKTSCLHSLVDAVADRQCCLLCLETCYAKCHRSIIANKLARIAQWTPIHLM